MMDKEGAKALIRSHLNHYDASFKENITFHKNSIIADGLRVLIEEDHGDLSGLTDDDSPQYYTIESPWIDGGAPFQERLDKTLEEVREELVRATSLYQPFRSAHEGYAILLEEVDELWEEVRKKPSVSDKRLMREEAVQIAAMAVRFVEDVCRE